MKRYISANILMILLLMMIVWAGIMVAKHNNNNNSDVFESMESINLSQGWVYNFHNGVSGVTDLPASLPENDSKALTLTNVLPTITKPMSFFYKVSHVPVKITVGDEVRVDRISGRDFSNYWNDMDGAYYQEVKIYPEDSGQTIEIYSYGNSKRYINGPGRVILGDRGTIFLSIINAKWRTLVFIGILGSLALFLFLLWLIILAILKTNSNEILCLSIYSFFVTLWLVTESEIFQFVLIDTGKMTVMAYELLMFMAMPMALFFYYYSERPRAKHIAKLLAIVPIFVFLAENFLQEMSLVHLTDSLFYSQVILGVETISIAIIQINEVRYKYRMKDNYNPVAWRIPLLGIALLAPMAGLEIAKYMLYSDSVVGDGIVIALGVLIYMFTLAVDSFAKLQYSMEKMSVHSRIKERQLSNLSGDIIAPANAILCFNNMLYKYSDDNAIREIALDMGEAISRLKGAINVAFDDAVTDDSFDVVYSEYNTVKLIHHLSVILTGVCAQKGLKARLEIDSNLPETLIGDSKHITQAMLIMINNGVTYTDKGEITLKIKVSEDSREDNKRCRIHFGIMDSGQGITDEEKKHILDMYNNIWRGQSKPDTHASESDVFLSRILKALDSQFQINSKEGLGAECFFEVEQYTPGSNAVGNINERINEAERLRLSSFDFSAPDVNILIADAEQMILESISVFFREVKINTDTAQNGIEALSKIKEKKYDLIILDKNMPKMDGLETASNIRNLSESKKDIYYATVPIIVMTTNMGLTMNDKLLIAGINDLLAKPIDIEHLNTMLKKWLPKEKVMDLREKSAVESAEDMDPRWETVPECVDLGLAKTINPSFDTYLSSCRAYIRKSGPGVAKLNEFIRREDIENLIIGVTIMQQGAAACGLAGLYEKCEEIIRLKEEGNNEKICEKATAMTSHNKLCLKEVGDFMEKNSAI